MPKRREKKLAAPAVREVTTTTSPEDVLTIP
jgi:hypothetical protein